MSQDPAPHRTPGPAELASAVPHPARIGPLLLLAHRRAAREFAAALRPLGFESKHYGVLAGLGQGPLSQRELIDRTQGDKSSMVRTVDDLEALGLVVRRPHPTDRRAHAVDLTPAGRAALAHATTLAEHTAARLLAPLPPADRDTLCDLLTAFVGGAEHA